MQLTRLQKIDAIIIILGFTILVIGLIKHEFNIAASFVFGLGGLYILLTRIIEQGKSLVKNGGK